MPSLPHPTTLSHLKLLSDISPTTTTTSSSSLPIPIPRVWQKKCPVSDNAGDNARICRTRRLRPNRGVRKVHISFLSQICELHVVIKHSAAFPGTDGAEGGSAQATNHDLLSPQVPPSTVSVSPDSPPTANITKLAISQNMSGSQVVEGPPDAETQEAPSVPTSDVCTPVNMTHTKW